MDSLGDFLTRIRNSVRANHRLLEVPTSKTKREITKLLFDKGYIQNYMFDEEGFGKIKIALKYNPVNKKSAISEIKRVSTPGLRRYCGAEELPRVLNGLGIAILSTSKGIMTEKEAKKEHIGGEILCYVS
jgi:small subunit ribosomal protein S8